MIKDLSVYYDTTALSEVLFISDAYFPYARFLDSFPDWHIHGSA
jgi:hypothetical protein